ncbi:MAG TPA: PAS domain S-box protein [Usitatibacter sp.]|jgi:PAS domain S-box-containing protein|nr:PAS domain S-box protein [Usitatibacter sp.]
MNDQQASRSATALRAPSYPPDLFQRLVEGVRDYAIFMLDPHGRIMSWNAGAQRIKGYGAAEVIGKHFSIFYTQDAIDRKWPQYELEAAVQQGTFEDEGWRVRKDGTRFWANVVLTPMVGEDGTLLGYSKVTRDLTERREQEERLRQSEERFRLLLEGVHDYAIMMLDPEGRVTSWNTGAERILGYAASEVLGRSFEMFSTPEDLKEGRPVEELRTARLNRRTEDRGWRVRKDGSRFWADVVVTALHDSHGELRGFAKVTRDLSDLKRVETLQEQGRHLNEFLAMLAHELRNPLAPLRNALSIMVMGGEELPPRVAWSHAVMDRQLTQLTRLVDDLLDVSRITRGKLRLRNDSMDLNDAVHTAIESARPLFNERAQKFEATLSAAPLMLNGDVARITQVAANLLNNAAKYTPEGGRVEVSSFTDGGNAVLRVSDTGIGIAPENIDFIFDLFAQGDRAIDRAAGGLGIGLTLARRIVEMHGGSIAVQSAGVGQGSRFEVRLPLLGRTPSRAKVE